MNERINQTEAKSVKTVGDAVITLEAVIDYFIQNPDEVSGKQVITLEEELAKKFLPDTDGLGGFANAWGEKQADRATQDPETGKWDFGPYDKVLEQLHAEEEGGSFNTDPDVWDEESYQEYRDLLQ
jgi:hypothetical protein